MNQEMRAFLTLKLPRMLRIISKCLLLHCSTAPGWQRSQPKIIIESRSPEHLFKHLELNKELLSPFSGLPIKELGGGSKSPLNPFYFPSKTCSITWTKRKKKKTKTPKQREDKRVLDTESDRNFHFQTARPSRPTASLLSLINLCTVITPF